MPFDQLNYAAPALKPSHPVRPAIPEGHRRLLVLAEFLETRVPDAHFRMAGYRAGAIEIFECGSTACALGWGGVIPEFVAAGYSCPRGGIPAFSGSKHPSSYEQVEEFFELPRYSGPDFFGTHHQGETPKQVAARLRAFVAEQSTVSA